MIKRRGFTLLELIVTVLLAAILVTLGVPAFRGMILSNRLTAQTNSLVTVLTLARSEAVRRGSDVWACGKASDWSNGVEVRVGGCASTDPLLRVSDPLAGDGLTLTPPSDSSHMILTGIPFNGLGAVDTPSLPGNASLPITFLLSDGSNSQLVCVNTVGHIRTLADTSACGS